jgi:PleD family two-component response regulator
MRPASRAFERPLKVLIVDDSEAQRESLRRLLSADGMKTFELPSAIGASREALQHGVDAAVIDVNATNQSGGRLAGLLRKNQRLAHLLIVVVSGQPADELIDLRGTADAIISKERVTGELTSTLRRLHSEALAARPFAGSHEA